MTVGVDDALEQLLGRRIHPTLLLHRPHDQIGRIVVILRVTGALAVDLRRRVLDEPLLVRKAVLEDLHVLEEVEVDDIERRCDVDAGVGIGNEVHHHVAIRHQLIGQVGVADAALDELEVRALDPGQLLAGDVKTDDLVFTLLDQMLDQVRADEPARTKNQKLHLCLPLMFSTPHVEDGSNPRPLLGLLTRGSGPRLR